MSNIKIFENDEFGKIRTVVDESGEVWFVGRDVAEILGYSNTRDALSKRVDDEDKKDGVAICDSIGRKQNPILINESGLYSLILSSKLPRAKEFKRWVTGDVLPSIRKEGGYIAVGDGESEKDILAKAMVIAQNTIKRLELRDKQKDQIIGELTPKADYTDRILKSKSVVPITSIAKDYGMSGSKFNKLLHELGVQYKQGQQWLLYAKYHSMGYTHSETIEFKRSNGEDDVSMITKWTQKGRLFLYNLLKDEGILPLIERV